MITEEQLRVLTPVQRGELMDRLMTLSAASIARPELQQTKRRLLRLFTVGCALLAGWTVVLGVTLPQHYRVANWQLTWTGFDLMLLAALVTTAWSLWRGRQLLVASALVTATMLVCDAWFDATTSRGMDDVVQSLVLAALVEIPLAIGLLVLSRRVLHRTISVLRGGTRPIGSHPLWQLRLAGLPQDDRVAASIEGATSRARDD